MAKATFRWVDDSSIPARYFLRLIGRSQNGPENSGWSPPPAPPDSGAAASP